MTAIKNIVFDVGGVLLKFDPMHYLTQTLGYQPLAATRIKSALFDSPQWMALDLGTITDQQAITEICSRTPNYAASTREVFKNWTDMLTPIHETVALFKKLKADGFSVFILSNFPKRLYDVFPLPELFELADGVVLSYQIRLAKPDPAIYQYYLDTYQCSAKESVFIDDLPQNIAAAQKLGFTGIQFTSFDAVLAQLDELGVSEKCTSFETPPGFGDAPAAANAAASPISRNP